MSRDPLTTDPVLLIENAAGASQEPRLLREGDLYEAVYMNVYQPLLKEIERLREYEWMYKDLCK